MPRLSATKKRVSATKKRRPAKRGSATKKRGSATKRGSARRLVTSVQYSPVKRRTFRQSPRSSPSQGWRSAESRIRTVGKRQVLFRKCGPDCFLIPSKLKFPVCTGGRGGCKVDCRGLLSAVRRGTQHDYPRVVRSARRLAEQYGCSWAH